jgi:ribosomal protein S12 methylthiotransferase accessory factor
MAASDDVIVITLPGGRRVDATVRGHRIQTDQPVAAGGLDDAPSPYELFLSSIGACAGIFVQGFCAKRGIDPSQVRILERPRHAPDGTLQAVELAIEVPPGFPTKYYEALTRVVEQCSVKRAIAAQPSFVVAVREGESSVPSALLSAQREPDSARREEPRDALYTGQASA